MVETRSYDSPGCGGGEPSVPFGWNKAGRVRLDRVIRIRAALASGEYRVSAASLAEAILRHAAVVLVSGVESPASSTLATEVCIQATDGRPRPS